MSRTRNKKKNARRPFNPLSQRDESPDQRRDILTHSIQLRASTADDEHRTVEAVVTSEQPVMVMDRETWKIIDEVLLCDGCELPERVSLLESHDRWSLDAVLGSVRNFKRETGAISAQLQFMTGDERADRNWPKVRDGHIDSVSIGYRVASDGFVDIPSGKTHTVSGRSFTAQDRTLRVVTSWEIHEVSLVVIPADKSAKVREDERQKNSENKGNKKMNEKVRKFLESLGLRADAGDDIAQAFLEGLSDEQRGRADAIGEGREAWPPVASKPAPSPTPEPGRAGDDPVDHDVVRVEAIRVAVRAAAEADKTRVASIREMAGKSVERALVDQAIDGGWDEARSSKAFLAHVAEKVEPSVGQTGPGIRTFAAPDVQSLSDGLILRGDAFPKPKAEDTNEHKLELEQRHELAERLRSIPLIEIARFAIQMDGGQVPMSYAGIAERAFSGSTLSNIFSTSANKILLAAYDVFPDSTQGWVQERTLSNFLTQDRLAGNSVGRLSPHAAGQEAKHLDISDQKESYRPYRYTGQFTIDDMDIINDSVGLLLDTPKQMGVAAAQLRPDSVYYALLVNATLDADSVDLFHADHGNLTTAALTAASLQAALSAMAKQRDAKGRPLNLRATHLIVPQDLRFTALNLLRSILLLGTSGGDVNVLASEGVVPVSDDRIGVAGVTDPLSGTAQVGTATNYFLADARANTIEVGYVTGRVPMLRQTALANGKWGINFDIKHDIGVKPLDYRGLHKCTGAS